MSNIETTTFNTDEEARAHVATIKSYGFTTLEGFNLDGEGWELILEDEFGDTVSVQYVEDTRPVREAIVAGTPELERVARFLPENYKVEVRPALHDEGDQLVIFGHDDAGWTLDGYVIPRLASGMIFAVEVN